MTSNGVIKMTSEINQQELLIKLIEQNNKLLEQNNLLIQINAEQAAQLSEVLSMFEEEEPKSSSASLDGG